jgi:branched-chain amino acid transport system permease protein
VIKVNYGSAGHWIIRALWVIGFAALVLYIPTKTETGTIGDMTYAVELAVCAMALNLVLGYTGVISIGHSAFYGLGGYATGILVTRYDWSPGWTIYAGVVIAFVAGSLVSLPALRLRGVYLALVTLALAVLFPALVKWQKLAWLTNGSRGINDVAYEEIPDWPFLGDLSGRDGRAVFSFWLAIVVAVVSYVVCRGIVKSAYGRSLVAIRDNEVAAAVMGVNRATTKMLVFGASAAMAAAAGSVATLRTTFVGPDIINLTLTGGITFLLVMVLGGAGTLWGPILGAVAFVFVDTRARAAGSGEGVIGWLQGDWFSGSPATLILAIVLIIFMFVAPFGLVGLLRRIARRFVVIVPKPAGTTHVPPAEAVADEIEPEPAPI